MEPENKVKQREEFFRRLSKNQEYNPIFKYPEGRPPQLREFAKPCFVLLPLAKRILDSLVDQWGTIESFRESQSKGVPVIQGPAAMEAAIMAFLKEHRLPGAIQLRFVPGSTSPMRLLSIPGLKGQQAEYVLEVRRELCIDRAALQGMLRHEVLGHYLRFRNHEAQGWAGAVGGNKKGLLEAEEGLAVLHDVMLQRVPSLYQASLYYYAVCRGSAIGFYSLFQELSMYLDGEEERYDLCQRVKRGLEETGVPGAFCRDQAYLLGVFKILKYRHQMDFRLLLAGRLTAEEAMERSDSVQTPHSMVDRSKVVTPPLLEHEAGYRGALECLCEHNYIDEFVAHLRRTKSPTKTPGKRRASVGSSGKKAASRLERNRVGESPVVFESVTGIMEAPVWRRGTLVPSSEPSTKMYCCEARCSANGCDFSVMDNWAKRQARDPEQLKLLPWKDAAAKAKAVCTLHARCCSAAQGRTRGHQGGA